MTLPTALACPLPSCKVAAGAAAHFGAIAALGGKVHTGLDLVAPIGTRVMAPAPGAVTRWIEDTAGGHGMEVEHKGYQTRYFHLSTRLARPGSSVNTGDTLARSGASGWVTGPHLHLEVHADGQLVDPEPLLFGGARTITPPNTIGGAVSMYPRGPGESCAPGYLPGTVNPGLTAGVPGTLWFARPTNPDGTIDACIANGLQPGDNGVAADVGDAFTAGLMAAVPVVVNLGVGVLVVVLAFSGAKQALSAGTI